MKSKSARRSARPDKTSRRRSQRVSASADKSRQHIKKSDQAKLIKLADKTSNLRAITFSPSPEWSIRRRLEYIDWAKKVVAGLRGASPWLEEQFDRAAQDAERSI